MKRWCLVGLALVPVVVVEHRVDETLAPMAAAVSRTSQSVIPSTPWT